MFFLFIGQNYGLSQIQDSCNLVLSGNIVSHLPDSTRFVKLELEGTNQKIVLNKKGEFFVNGLCPGKVVLTGIRFGEIFILDTIIMAQNEFRHYHINKEIKSLDEVDVVVDRYFNETMIKARLTQKQIDKVSGLPLGIMLEGINGVRTLKTGSSIAKPVIHGMHSNRILVINNGIKQEGQQWGREHAPEIDPFVSNSISVIKGAGSIKYGFDATAGVVLIEPKVKTDSSLISGDLNITGQSNGRQGGTSLSLFGRSRYLKPLTWSMQGSVKKGGNIHTPNYFLKNTGMQEFNFSAGLNWIKTNYGVSFFYSQFNTDIGIFSGSHIGNLTDLQFAFEQNEPIEKADFSYELQRPMQHIEHELTKGKFYFRTGNIGRINVVYGRQYNLRYEFDKHQSLNDSIAALKQPELQFEITTHSLNVNWKHYEIKKFIGEIGVDGVHQKNTYSGRYFIPNFTNRGLGMYWIEKRRFNKWQFEGGARYDVRYLQIFKWENGVIISPKHNFKNFAANLGFRYHIYKKGQIFINLSKTWRPPNVSEMYSNGLHHGAAAIEIGDRNLGTEKANNLSLEFVHLGKRVHFQVNPYLNYFQNYIYLEPKLPPTLTIKGAFPTFAYKETKAYISGLDATLNVRINSFLSNTTKVSYVRGYNISANDYLIQMPADFYQDILTVNFQNFKVFTKNSIEFKYTYVAHQDRVPVNSDFAPPPSAYHLVDVQLMTNLTLKRNTMGLSLAVNNLFNLSYRDYMNRFRYYSDEMGRNFIVRLKIPLTINNVNNK